LTTLANCKLSNAQFFTNTKRISFLLVIGRIRVRYQSLLNVFYLVELIAMTCTQQKFTTSIKVQARKTNQEKHSKTFPRILLWTVQIPRTLGEGLQVHRLGWQNHPTDTSRIKVPIFERGSL